MSVEVDSVGSAVRTDGDDDPVPAADPTSNREPLEYAEYVNRLQPDYPDLAAEFAGRDSIEYVIDWIKRRGLAPGSVDIVGQDEFSYDFLIQLEPNGRWLVFGVN